MSTTLLAPPPTSTETLADLVHRLGDIPLERIRMHPAPGTATEDDVISVPCPTCELIEGVLVERAMGFFEGRLAFILGVIIEEWLKQSPIGFCNGEGGYLRLQYGLVRIPDAAFTRWERTTDDKVPRDPICGVSPNLAVEVLSRTNTRREIDRKRQEYFDAAVELVWITDPDTMTVEVWSTAKDCKILDADDVLDGGTVLPGFRLPIREWFQRAEGLPPTKS